MRYSRTKTTLMWLPGHYEWVRWNGDGVRKPFLSSDHVYKRGREITQYISLPRVLTHYVPNSCEEAWNTFVFIIISSWCWNVAGDDDVIKWKHFPCYWPFVRGIHRSPEHPNPIVNVTHDKMIYNFYLREIISKIRIHPGITCKK